MNRFPECVSRRRARQPKADLFGALSKEHAGKESRDENKAFSGAEKPQWLIRKVPKP
jgi:hypothetical protein